MKPFYPCNKATALLTAVLAALLVLGAGGGASPDAMSNKSAAKAASEVALLDLGAEGARLAVRPTGGFPDLFEAELWDLQGDLRGEVQRRHDGRSFEVTLPAELADTDPEDLYLRYRLGRGEAFRQRSLVFLSPLLETIVLGQREYLAGSRPVLRLLVRDRARGEPAAGAEVHVTLSSGETCFQELDLLTDDRGEAPVQLELPAPDVSKVELLVSVKLGGAKDEVRQSLALVSGVRTLLTTDKPIYQPGQTIHMRALSLSRPDLVPLGGAVALFEVQDAKGNKVFKRELHTDAFGVSHADFVLASELNEGRYRIRHTAGGRTEEKTVNVERYVLPRFKIALTTDRRYYLPGEMLRGDLQVDYFFGKPVAGGDVHVACAKFDVAFTDFQTVEGKTDDGGHYRFEVRLPDHFVGQPFEAGNASVRLDVSVIDGADHREGTTRSVTVTASPLVIAAVPEGGELVPGLENRVHLVTTQADGSPVACRVTWANPPEGGERILETDAGGFGGLSFTPSSDQPVKIELKARDAQGHAGATTVTLPVREKTGDDRLLLRLDRALYRVGDRLALTTLATRSEGTLYVDLIKDRQTFLTATYPLRAGRAAGEIALGPELSGTLQVSAYLIGDNGVIVRDRRIVVVDPANALSVEVKADRPVHRPGEQARLHFQVHDREGAGVPAVLGISIVDEAVYALQELQPGLEKVYFYLEREIAKPRYEIHGQELDGIVFDGPRGGIRPEPPAPEELGRREQAARVLLASAAGAEDHTLAVNTSRGRQELQQLEQKLSRVLAPDYGRIQAAFQRLAEKRSLRLNALPESELTLRELVRTGELRRSEVLDPWSEPYRLSWAPGGHGRQANPSFSLQSAGIDGRWDTADDVVCDASDWALWRREILRRARVIERGGRRFVVDEQGREIEAFQPFDVEGAKFMVEVKSAVTEQKFEGDKFRKFAIPAIPEAPDARTGALLVRGGRSDEVAIGGVPAPRIRRYFPETLLFAPAVITDGTGRAELDVPLADSITEWRLGCLASSGAGELGSATAGLRVFQDFFVDVDFPVALTQHDRVSVPVAVHNYLDGPQRVRLVVEPGDWFSLAGPAEKTVELEPGEVTAVYFPIFVERVGVRKLTVLGYGTQMSDAVSRTVEITPDGREETVTLSGRLSDRVTHAIQIPASAVPDASKILVRLYPGVLSQVLAGLDGMLRMPSGCFEQTSSVTYPNVIVLDYLQATKQLTPELQMTAEGFINNGYQRLLSFEVQGGGFEWFGNAPAHRILTAYGLMEFHDMSKVHPVDPAVIARTQRWLAAGQEQDGSWQPSTGGIREGAINKFTDDVLRTTAYVTWALAHSGYAGPELTAGARYVTDRLDTATDVFTLALVANALATVDPQSPATARVLDRLLEARVEDADTTWWPCESETPTHGRGETATIEVTGLAVQALLAAGRDLGTVGKAVNYLASRRDAYGSWQSTQATIQALRAMLRAEREVSRASKGRVTIALDGAPVDTLTVDKNTADLLRLVDLGDDIGPGQHRVDLSFTGKGALLYQVVGRFYDAEQFRVDLQLEEPLAIDLKYDRTRLATDDLLNVEATVAWQQPGRAKMVIVDLGLPPGFTLIADDLDLMVQEEKIQKYDTTGRQIIVYLEELAQGAPLTISYQLRAKYPLNAKTARSSVYEYYNPTSRAEAEPIELEVAER
jgi:uncharacterized protein YfaS (alpha-2-macroglobulin family)